MSLTKHRIILVSPLQFLVLEAVHSNGPCSSVHVSHLLGEDADHLLVMRSLHHLVDRGFLRRITINNSTFYETSPNFGNIRSYLKIERGVSNDSIETQL